MFIQVNMKIQNTKTTQQQRVKVLIYGETGSGKTSLAATLGKDTLVISGESGLLSIKDAELEFVDISRDDKGEVITEVNGRLTVLRDVFTQLHDNEELKKKYKNVFVDGITEIGELMVESISAQFPDRKDSFPMWGEYSKRMRSVIKNFRDLPYNVFMTAVAEPDVDESKPRYMGFQVAGSIGRKMPQYFDEVFYLYVDGEGKRSLVTKKTDALVCKDRSNKLAPTEEPDLSLIMAKIFNQNIKKEK
jgi:hypothetical protein